MISFTQRDDHAAGSAGGTTACTGRTSHLLRGDGAGAMRKTAGGSSSRVRSLECRHLVLALPVNRSLSLITAALPGQPPPQTVLPEARILSVLMGFDDTAKIPFGFGYLAPEKEGRFALGALFSSHMFPGRAPQGCQLLEALVGGAGATPSGWS